jgi:hypothetical protein
MVFGIAFFTIWSYLIQAGKTSGPLLRYERCNGPGPNYEVIHGSG